MIRLGIDIGSTTVKLVVIDEKADILYTKYERHNARVKEVLALCLQELMAVLGDREVSVRMTGSIGMGMAEKYSIPFVQEVVAAAKAIRKDYQANLSRRTVDDRHRW